MTKNPIRDVARKRVPEAVTPAGNKHSDGLARKSALSRSRQVGMVPSELSGREAKSAQKKYTGVSAQTQNLTRAIADPVKARAGPALGKQNIDGGAPHEIISQVMAVLLLVAVWDVIYGPLSNLIFPSGLEAQVFRISYWGYIFDLMAANRLWMADYVNAVVFPLLLWLGGLAVGLLLLMLFFGPVLRALSWPTRKVMGLLHKLPLLKDFISAKIKKSKQPRRSSIAFGKKQKEEKNSQDRQRPKLNFPAGSPQQAEEDRQSTYREKAIQRRKEKEEAKKKAEEDGEDGEDDGFSGAGGSVPSGGVSPNAIAAAAAGRSGNSNG